VLAHRGRRGQCFVYELLYDGQGKSGKPFLIGLIDVEQLRFQKFEGSGDNFEGAKPKFEAPLRPQRGAVVPPSSLPEKALSSRKNRALLAAGIPLAENARPGNNTAPPPS
jgi:hypothetical protein